MERIGGPGGAVYVVRRPDWRGAGRLVAQRLRWSVGLAAVGTAVSPPVALPALRAFGLVS